MGKVIAKPEEPPGRSAAQRTQDLERGTAEHRLFGDHRASAKSEDLRQLMKSSPRLARLTELQSVISGGDPLQRMTLQVTKRNEDTRDTVVNSVDDFGRELGMTGDDVVGRINGYCRHPFTKEAINQVIRDHPHDWIFAGKGSNPFSSLAELCRNSRSDVVDVIDNIKEGGKGAHDADFAKVKKNYSQTGKDDKISVEDEYKPLMACTLYALRAVKPHFMGAGDERELHQILRSFGTTKKYDEDEMVAKIRLAAGLKFSEAFKGKTVEQLIADLDKNSKKQPLIVDLDGAAHTFALVKNGDAWKKVDNEGGDWTKFKKSKIAGTWQ